MNIRSRKKRQFQDAEKFAIGATKNSPESHFSLGRKLGSYTPADNNKLTLLRLELEELNQKINYSNSGQLTLKSEARKLVKKIQEFKETTITEIEGGRDFYIRMVRKKTRLIPQPKVIISGSRKKGRLSANRGNIGMPQVPEPELPLPDRPPKKRVKSR